MTITSFKDYQVICCVDYFRKAGYCQCHIYSCPYTLIHYNNVTNNFSGGSFDERSFEHEFFIRISQAFPFLKVLFIMSSEQQTFKQEQESNNDNRTFSIIEHSHLILLGLQGGNS